MSTDAASSRIDDARYAAPTKGPLSGVSILDMSRLAPGPYATMLLADLGAEVTVVGGGRAGLPLAEVSRGKRFISLDLKSTAGQQALHRLVAKSDVFVESFRPGVAAKLGASYPELRNIRPDLIYCSLTGYGQDGPMRDAAGHDINYLAMTGMLAMLGPTDGPPSIPLNLVADFAGGSLVAAMAIAAALFERTHSGAGQYLDVAMIDGVWSMMSMHRQMWGTSAAPSRGESVLAGAAPFYRCYETSDGRYMAVGALEPQFFTALWSTLGLGAVPPQYPRTAWPRIEADLTAVFASRTRAEWTEVFAGVDACVSPVLDPDEVCADSHIRHRHNDTHDSAAPAIPRLSRTPAQAGVIDRTDHTEAVLSGAGLTAAQISAAHDTTEPTGLTGWPDM